jgi:hypothetical protein
VKRLLLNSSRQEAKRDSGCARHLFSRGDSLY